MTDLALIAPKLCRLIPRLGTDQDGEIVATVRAIRRTLAAAGLDLHDLAHAIEAPRVVYREADPSQRMPQTWLELARWIVMHDDGRLAPKERKFARSMAARLVLNGEPTEKQAAWLRALHAKLGGDAA